MLSFYGSGVLQKGLLFFSILMCYCGPLHFYPLNDAVFESILCVKIFFIFMGTLFNIVMYTFIFIRRKTLLSGFGCVCESEDAFSCPYSSLFKLVCALRSPVYMHTCMLTQGPKSSSLWCALWVCRPASSSSNRPHSPDQHNLKLQNTTIGSVCRVCLLPWATRGHMTQSSLLLLF